jgi:hypothetical protein
MVVQAKPRRMRNDTGLRYQMARCRRDLATFFLTNGDVAWSLDEVLGTRFMEGTYELPQGWRVAEVREVDNWKLSDHGMWRREVPA